MLAIEVSNIENAGVWHVWAETVGKTSSTITGGYSCSGSTIGLASVVMLYSFVDIKLIDVLKNWFPCIYC